MSCVICFTRTEGKKRTFLCAPVYIVLCIVFDVGRRCVYMWRGLDGAWASVIRKNIGAPQVAFGSCRTADAKVFHVVYI